MTTPSPDPSSPDPLDLVISLFLDAESRGELLDRDALLLENPSLASELVAFFADHDRMKSFAPPLDPDATGPNPFLAPTGTHYSSSLLRNTPRLRLKYVGDYELIDEIASGGMGVVYLARQITLNRVVAVKMILSGVLADADSLRRFRQEAESAAALDHPNIVPIYEVGEHESQPYFSMKLIDGPNLADVLSRDSRPPRRDLVRLLMTVALAVDHAHRRGVLHRDLKPRNILLDPSGSPHVTDFGLARRLESDSDLTATGGTPGTPSYMAPEQARGVRKPTVGVDVYGLGAILYEILTGRPPHRADSPLETLRLVIDAEPVAPRELDPTVDRDLETIALKCLEKDPERRYGSALSVAEELARWLDGRPILARPLGRVEKGWRWCRRNHSLATAGGVAIVGLLIATTMSIAYALQSRNRARAEKDRADIARKAQKDSDTARNLMEGSLARGLAKSLDPEGEDKNTLTLPEAESLWDLACSENSDLGPRFIFEALRDPMLLKQLYGRSEPAMIAAIGLDTTKRAKAMKFLDAMMHEPGQSLADRGRTSILAIDLVYDDDKFAELCVIRLRESIINGISNAPFWINVFTRDGATNVPVGQHWLRLQNHLPPITLAVIVAELLKTEMKTTERQALVGGFIEAAEAVENATKARSYGSAEVPNPASEARRLAEAIGIFDLRIMDRQTKSAESGTNPEDEARILIEKLRHATESSEKLRIAGYLPAIARRMEPVAAARILSDAIAREADAYALSSLAQDLAVLARRMRSADAARPLADAARLLTDTLGREVKDHEKRRALADGLSAVAIRMAPSDAVLPLADAARALTNLMSHEISGYGKWMIAKDLVSVAARMDQADNARVLSDAARLLSDSLSIEPDAEQRRDLAFGLATVAAQMDRANSSRVSSVTLRLLFDVLAREPHDGNRLALAGGVASVAARLDRADAAMLTGAARVLAEEIGSNHDIGGRRELADGLTAVTAKMEPENATRLLVDLMAREFSTDDRMVMGEGLRTEDVRFSLARGLAAVAARMRPEEGARTCRSILAILAKAKFEAIGADQTESNPSLRRATAALLPWIDASTARVLAHEQTYLLCSYRSRDEESGPSDLDALLRDDSRRERAYRDAMFDLAWSLGGPIEAEMVLAEPYPCRLTDQELVELLKMPTCFGPARMVVLKHLGNRHGREFKHHWEFVRFAREDGLKLDFTTPPKRPDPKESLKRMIEALERAPAAK